MMPGRTIPLLVLLFGNLLALDALASVLPDDRSDVLYHRYEGGGVVIDGPSVLVRKKATKNLSVVGNYYVDYVSSASIDVVTTASPYDEERTQWSLGADYLRGNTTLRGQLRQLRGIGLRRQHRGLLRQSGHVRTAHDADIELRVR